MNLFSDIQSSEQFEQALEQWLSMSGYELVTLETINQRQRVMRLFIDRLNGTGVGIEDCVIVSRGLDEPLENCPYLNKVFPQGYELEVSSPGIDRPLRKPADFDKFSGREVRIHTFRSLKADEIENPEYAEKNPKQKNFLGQLIGLNPDGLKIGLKIQLKKDSAATVWIPKQLVSKAQLEPDFNKEKKA